MGLIYFIVTVGAIIPDGNKFPKDIENYHNVSLSNGIPLLRSQAHSRPAMLSFLPFPTNADTVLQPVNARKNDNAFDLGPMDLTIE